MVRVLIVSESTHLIAMVQRAFEGVGFHLYVAEDQLEAMLFLDREPCDVLLLEAEEEGSQALTFCPVVRRSWDVGLFLIFHPSAEEDLMSAYQMGTDGHLTLPFDVRELAARVGGVARRVQVSRAERTKVPDTSIPQRLGGVAEIG